MKKTITILSILILFSCGSRRVEKTETKEEKIELKSDISRVKSEEKTESKSVNILDSEKNKETKLNISNNEIIFVPIDPLQESSFTDSSGKVTTFKNLKGSIKTNNDNSVISESEITNEVNVLKQENNAFKDSISLLNSLILYNKDSEYKNVEKTFSLWNLLWLLIPIALYFRYR